MANIKYDCISDRYTPGRQRFDSVDEFLAMCKACFGETPALRQIGDEWHDDLGPVLEQERRTWMREVTVLRHDGETDYTLEAPSCWITVGELSVYIRRTERGVVVEVLEHGDEMGAVLASCAVGDERGDCNPD